MVSLPLIGLLIQNRPVKVWLEAQALRSDRLGLGCRLARGRGLQSLSFPIFMMDITRMLVEIKAATFIVFAMPGP